MCPAVWEHAEKSIGWQASPCLRAKPWTDSLIGAEWGGVRAPGDPSHLPLLHRWERLELSCCISLQRLTDPAKGVGCNHRARQAPP